MSFFNPQISLFFSTSTSVINVELICMSHLMLETMFLYPLAPPLVFQPGIKTYMHFILSS